MLARTDALLSQAETGSDALEVSREIHGACWKSASIAWNYCHFFLF